MRTFALVVACLALLSGCEWFAYGPVTEERTGIVILKNVQMRQGGILFLDDEGEPNIMEFPGSCVMILQVEGQVFSTDPVLCFLPEEEIARLRSLLEQELMCSYEADYWAGTGMISSLFHKRELRGFVLREPCPLLSPPEPNHL